jgi:hypothetical protein
VADASTLAKSTYYYIDQMKKTATTRNTPVVSVSFFIDCIESGKCLIDKFDQYKLLLDKINLESELENKIVYCESDE